jgi:hypothetical protein
MNKHSTKSMSGSTGSAILITVVMLAIAGIIMASILVATITYARNTESTQSQDRAAFLADAGIHAALVKLNYSAEGNISSTQSRSYFAISNMLTASEWGFQTVVMVTNMTNWIVSTGWYDGHEAEVRAAVSLGAGNRSIHALYAHALFAGDSIGATNYVLQVGGTGSGADFVQGDSYSGGSIALSGDSKLRLPESFTDYDGDGICDISTDKYVNAYATQVFTNPLTQAAFNTYTSSVAANQGKFYNNGTYDYGEAFVDTIGNGVYDIGEPFTDLNGNGRWDPGDSFRDRNGNGVYDAGIDTVIDTSNGQWDPGEEWTEDSAHSQRVNRKYDRAGGYWSGSTWKTTYKVGSKTYSCASWPAESYVDSGDGAYQTAEPYIDQNGIYDVGETFYDDRNSLYDYGTQAKGSVSGMPAPGDGQKAATGYDRVITPPDLTHMYYAENRNSSEPAGALDRWGNDVAVTASDYGTYKVITDTAAPEHIFIMNPPTSGSVSSRGKTVQGRSYTKTYTTSGTAVNDFFLEDPTDVTYNSTDASRQIALNDSGRTCPMLINVLPTDNVKLYYVDGNVYIHSPTAYSFQFRQPDTRITIVASGNIIISDEFYYKANYPAGLQYSNMSSRVVSGATDALCLIALKNPAVTNSGNIVIGDSQFGTGGSIHAMLYAENNFVDNNLDTTGQPYISIFGNMTAGNQILLNRSTAVGHLRTRLDISLDERIRNGTIIVPGLPHPLGSERSIELETAWQMIQGTWSSWSFIR